MRKNLLGTEAHKLLSLIPVEHRSVRAILRCFDNDDPVDPTQDASQYEAINANDDPVDPTQDASQYEAINAVIILKNILFDEKLFKAEEASLWAILENDVIRNALYRTEIIYDKTILHLCLDDYNASQHLKKLLSWKPVSEEDKKFYSTILEIILKGISHFLNERQSDVIALLFSYSLTISDYSFEKICGSNRRDDLFKVAIQSGCQFSPAQLNHILECMLRLREWDFIEKNIIPIHSLTEKNKELYNKLFLASVMHKQHALSFAILEKHQSHLNYAMLVGDIMQNTVLHHLMSNEYGDVERWEVASILRQCLKGGADLALQNRVKKTPIQLAADRKDWVLMTVILKYIETDKGDTFKLGYALLLMAREKNWSGCDALLQQKNIRLDFCEPESLGERAGWTALNYFIAEKQDHFIALCYERGAALSSMQTELPVPEDAKVVYDFAFDNRGSELWQIVSDSNNPSYLINFSAYGAAAGNHTDLLAYLKDEGAEEKFIAAGKIKWLQKSSVAVSVAASSAAFLPPPRSTTGDAKKSAESACASVCVILS